MNYWEERQYLKDWAYLEAERRILEIEILAEWQEEIKQKPAKIVVIREEKEIEQTKAETI